MQQAAITLIILEDKNHTFMRKTITLFMLLFPFLSVAQRSTNIQVALLNPTNGQAFSNHQFNLDILITNLGSDSLFATDTGKFILSLNGIPAQFQFGNQFFPYQPFLLKDMAPGDTMHLTKKLALYSTPFGNHTICTKVMLLGGDCYDPDTMNNKRCATIKYVAADVNELEQAGSLTIYPVPAHDKIYFQTDRVLPRSMVVEIYSITGELALSKVATQSDGLDISSLPAGAYIYRLRSDNNLPSGKFVKY